MAGCAVGLIERLAPGQVGRQILRGVLGGILGGLLGRKVNMTTLSRGSSAIGRATSAYKQHQDVAMAGERVEDLAKEMETLRAEMEEEVRRLAEEHDVSNLKLETETLKPSRSDVKVGQVALLWLC